MNLGYQVSKNRLTTSISLEEEQAFRLRRLAASESMKLSPFIGRLIDQEWERTDGREEPTELAQVGERVA